MKPLGGARGRRKVQLRKLLAPLWQKPIVLTARDGLKLELTADPVDELVANSLLGRNRGLWFPPPPAGIDDVTDPTVVLDLGAHHGFYAAVALRRYQNAKLVAVEPSTDGVARVRRNLALNGYLDRVRIVNAALAERSGRGTLLHTDEGSWGSSLFQEQGVEVLDQEQVDLLTLTDIVGDERPDVLKCNAEGAEFALVEQLAASDLRPALMIVMVHPELGDLDATRATIEGLGYHIDVAGSDHHPVLQAWRRPPAR